MSILADQSIIGDKVISNDITTDPEARSLTMRNGYYSDHRYPDNRSEITGESFSVAEDSIDREAISESKTAGQIG
jgi:hypothetical protein|tara:strand:- start:97 stop:321 length:225 start_codon:yes stop_codon:yes gene_type:complete